MATHRLLVFGASGAIGGAIAADAAGRGWSVTGVARKVPVKSGGEGDAALPGQPHPFHDGTVKRMGHPGSVAGTEASGIEFHALDPLADDLDTSFLAEAEPFDAVCWAQGANVNDTIGNVDLKRHMEIYEANCVYILATLQALLRLGKLRSPARLCVISSIWQNLARQSKLTYCMTKAALQGLVLACSADLAAEGHVINAVLPGALDTPMTRKNLSAEQIDRLTGATQFGRLPSLHDVSSTVLFLCSPENTGITGQFVAADLGFSHVRIV